MGHDQLDVEQLLPARASQRIRDGMPLLFGGSAALVVVLSIARAAVFWRSEAYLDDASGNWTALAKDLTAGVFYRPLSGPDGFGGSRYFPLHFVLHAGLMRAGIGPVRAGHLLAAASLVLLIAAIYVLLRRLGAPRLLAAAASSFVLAAQPTQEALLAIKGDGLAAALNVWGLALCAGPALGTGGLLLAAVVFAMAFATKVTALSGLAAATLMWLAEGRWASAARLLLFSGAGMVLVLAVMYVGSHGVVFDVLRASATGGAGIRDLLRAPFTLARQTRRVPETLAVVQLGFAALVLLLAAPKPLQQPAVLFFLCVTAVTVLIFGSPGTDTNHLIDLDVASLVAVACVAAAARAPYGSFAGAALVVAALAGSLSLMSGLVNAQSEQRRGTFAEALALIPDHTGPILAQNPLVPLSAGQRPYLVDPFLIRLQTERDPRFGEPLWTGIRNHQFAAVVFERDPDASRELYKVILGDRFVEEVERAYAPAAHVGQRVIFLPRSR